MAEQEWKRGARGDGLSLFSAAPVVNPRPSGSGIERDVFGRDDQVELARASGADKARAATAIQPTGRADKVAGVADIGNALKAGQITPQAALDRVVERIVTRQVGAHGPAAIKKNLSAALRQTLEDDPMLAAKLRALGDE